MRGKLVSAMMLLALAMSSAVEAAEHRLMQQDLRKLLRQSAKTGEKVTLRNVDLGGEALSTIELEPMKVWADGAVVAIHGSDGTARRERPLPIHSFRGRVVGAADDGDALIYMSLRPNGRVEGQVLVGQKRFHVGTAIPIARARQRGLDDMDLSSSPVVIRREDGVDDLLEGKMKGFTCDLEKLPMSGDISIPVSEEQRAARLRQQPNAGNVMGAAYTLRLTMETDTELYVGLGSSLAAVQAYLTDLVGKASLIYQRDLNTTIVVGHTNIYTGGSDPWVNSAAAGTDALLAELGTYYASTQSANLNYGGTQRSTVAWISGRITNGGIAWVNVLCQGNFFCGSDGALCNGGTPSATWANQWGGGYSFNGSAGFVETGVNDPTVIINGVEFGMGSIASNFWMLAQFTHELGHNVASPHTHCVALTAQEKSDYSVTRNFVDECFNGEGGCSSATQVAPPEKGTIMSYCHNLVDGLNNVESRYRFWKAGETSEKMRTILIGGVGTGLEGATPNPTITAQAEPVACSSGRTASVATCSGCTYAWNIDGGSITTSTSASSIQYTPSSASAVLTVTVTAPRGCGITLSKTIATACGAITAPTGFVAVASGSNSVGMSWNEVTGATEYRVYRRSAPGGFTLVDTVPAPGTSTNDNTASANTAYLYMVRAFNGTESGDSNVDLATTVTYLHTVGAGEPIRAANFNELRTAALAVEALAGTSTGSFTGTINSAATIEALHAIQIRTKMNVALAALGFTQVALAAPSPGTVVTADLINEARVRVQ